MLKLYIVSNLRLNSYSKLYIINDIWQTVKLTYSNNVRDFRAIKLRTVNLHGSENKKYINLITIPVEDERQALRVIGMFQVKLELCSSLSCWESNDRSPGHAISEKNACGTPRHMNGLATSVRAGHQAALGGCHGNHVFKAIKQKRPCNTQ